MSQVAALTMSQLKTTPRISNSMTIAQLHTECRARDPGIKGLSNKNKTWLLDHLKIGTPLVSAEVSTKDGTKDTSVAKKSTACTKRLSLVSKAPEKKKAAATNNAPKVAQAEVTAVIHTDMTIAQLQMECRARDPDIKGLTNKNKSWFLDHLTIGSKCFSVGATITKEPKKSEVTPSVKKTTTATKKKPTAKKVPEKEVATIHADMTLEELQMECRARNSFSGNISIQTKSYLLKHLGIGSARAPVVHEGMTLAQLRRECNWRDMHLTGLSKKNKTWLLDHLKIGTCWTSSSQWNGNERISTKMARRYRPPVHTRVSSKMTVWMLTQEARARNLCTIPKIKSDLIDLLGEGSICVKTNDSTTSSIPASNPKSETVKVNDKKPVSKSTPVVRQTKLNFGTPTLTIRKLSPKKTEQNRERNIDEGPSTKRVLQPLKESNKRPISTDQCGKHSSGAKSGSSKKKRKTSIKPSGAENSLIATPAAANSFTAPAENPSTSNTVAKYTRITNKMTIEQLKEEAEARRMETIPKAKCRILEALVEGSICLCEAPEYKTYQNLLKKMKMEEPALLDKQNEKLRIVEERREKEREKRRVERERKLAEEEREREKQWRVAVAEEQRRIAEAERAREEERKAEIARQASLHVHSFPRVHKSLLAKTSDLTIHGRPRTENGTCDVCDRPMSNFRSVGYYSYHSVTPLYTCESQDWDICTECFKEQNMTKAEKAKVEAEKEKLRLQREEEYRKREEEYRKQIEEENRKREEAFRKQREEAEKKAQKEQEDRERRLDETNFSLKIRVVKGKHLDPKSSGMKYTVWCSEEHKRCWDEPDKEFDSVWATKKEANSRAEYLFYWKNAWGLSIEEMNYEYVEPMERDGLKGYSCTPDGGGTWKVGIVPSDAFPYLDKASFRRRYHD